MPLASGTWIGPYEITGWLGAGGMGEVYRGRDPRLGRDVAIKLIPETFASDTSRLQRFEQEARASGQLNHPNILAVYDVGTHQGAPYIVAELLEGESLRARLQNGAVAARKAVDYARQIAEGLAAAHDKGIVHRDLKPDNLFITTDGRVKILDFGIAKLTRPGGEQPSPPGAPTDTGGGLVVGTPGYMSPEQVRGEPVDARSDIFSFGTMLYEMLTGRQAFTRATSVETMAAILKEDPPAPLAPEASPALARILSRCLEKTREARFQSARDLAFGLEYLSGENATATPGAVSREPRRWRTKFALALGALILAVALASWLIYNATPASIEDRLARATVTPFITSEGPELDATISPDGTFVSFLAPSTQDGPFHVWFKRVGSGEPIDLTKDKQVDQRNPAAKQRSAGFSNNPPEIWVNGSSSARRRLQLVQPGGSPHDFLPPLAVNVAWSSSGKQLAYFTSGSVEGLPAAQGDSIYVADEDGGNAHKIFGSGKRGDHNHFLAWSADDRWIYFACGFQSVADLKLCRIPSSGDTATPERLSDQANDVSYLTPIDERTVLYIAPDEDKSGPWLWALDVERRETRRVSTGLERYLSVGASANGLRLVATVVTQSTAGLWSVPILDRGAEARDVQGFPPAGRALAPRFGAGSLFYLSSSGPGDGLWRVQNQQAPVEIWNASKGALLESPSVSPVGDRVAVVLRKEGKLQLALVSLDGADSPRSLAEGIDVRGTAAWSRNGESLVTGGRDAQGPGLFIIAVRDGRYSRLADGPAFDPVWSPTEDLIVYSGQQSAVAPLLAVRSDKSKVDLPTISVPAGGGGRARFLPNGKGLVYLRGPVGEQDFYLLDFSTNQSHQLTRLSNPATIYAFDVTPDGTHIVFDRVRESSDIRLIDLPKR